MITIFQPIWGPLPDKYKPYVESTLAYCNRIGAEYVSPQLPDEYKDWKFLENVKDYMLWEYMTRTSYVLGVDWDIDLHDSFCIPDIEKPFRGGDCCALIYNGNNINMGIEIVKLINEYPRDLAKNELSRGWKCAQKYIVNHPVEYFDPNTYKHFQGS